MKKKLLFALVIVLIMSFCAFSSVKFSVRIGYLTKLNTTEDDFKDIILSSNRTNIWSIFPSNHDVFGVHFYDSLRIMLMALNANEIDEMALPEMTASYILHVNPSYEACCAAHTRSPMSLAFGFRDDDQELQQKFNAALKSMEDDFTLAYLQGHYITDQENFEPVKLEHFDGAIKIKAAVTGDMPPMDFSAENGEPAGFNTALLAEIGRRLKINIDIIQVDAAARTTALTSGRADVIFWYETSKFKTYTADAPKGVILSEPYYSWNTFLHLRKKQINF